MMPVWYGKMNIEYLAISKNISLYCMYGFSLYSFHNFSLRFILKIFLKIRKFKLPCSYKALRVYLLLIDLTLAAFPTHGPNR